MSKMGLAVFRFYKTLYNKTHGELRQRLPTPTLHNLSYLEATPKDSRKNHPGSRDLLIRFSFCFLPTEVEQLASGRTFSRHWVILVFKQMRFLPHEILMSY